ncbi:hypothetical protein EQ500_03575, partial [Lactobacillus sp. XV13L]|nr:hypothetical protein [Lactobacillus sp. XV13L]
VTAAALGMLALSNPETVNADSLAGHQPKIAKKVIAAAQREVNTASDNLTQKKAAKDASHPASGPDAGAKDSDNDIAGDDTALVKVTVHYVDQDGKPIPAAPDETISGKAGDEYPEKAIPGYKLMDKSGEKFSADETEVTYTYRAKSEAADAPLLAPRETEAIDDWMPDKNLQKLVALNLKKSVSEITKADVAAMDSLSIYPVATKNKTDYQNAMSIESLEGMQYATNLKILDLSPDINSNNQFFQNPMVHGALNDISALKDLQKLNNVKVQMCNISDISALGNKPNLVNLSISYNHIMDFSPLKTDPVLYPSVQAYYQSVALPVKQIPQGTSKYTSGPYEFFDADGSRIPIRVADTDDFDHDHYVKFYLSTQPGTPSADGKFVEWDMSKFTAGDRGYMTVNYRGKLFGSAGYPSGGWYIIPFEIVNGLSVTAHYKDTAGNMIAPDETITGVSGDNYPDKDIKGYTLKSKSSEKFTSTETEVTYVYAKDIIPGKDVTVHYRDT